MSIDVDRRARLAQNLSVVEADLQAYSASVAGRRDASGSLRLELAPIDASGGATAGAFRSVASWTRGSLGTFRACPLGR
jgi:hypothetical protein